MGVPAGWGMESVRSVRVRLTVEPRRDLPLWPGDDVSMPREEWGNTIEWVYAVARDPSTDRYLIFGQGKM